MYHHNFNFCIWACIDEKHPWNRYNNASRQGLHINIESNISTLESAKNIFDRIVENNSNNITKIFLDPTDPVTDIHYDLNSLYFNAYLFRQNNHPPWWPPNPHISFYYSYGKSNFKGFNQLFYNQRNIQQNNSAKITKFKLVYCRGHYNLHWIVVKEHKIIL